MDRFDPENNFFLSQGSNYGTKALHLLYGDANDDADRVKNLRKDGFSRRGTPHSFRPLRNWKRRGRKTLTKRERRELARI
jgi:hypothetical protein